MKVKNSLFSLIFLMIVFSCSKTFDTPEEINAYIKEEDNGYYYKKTIEGVDYELQYRPTDLLVKQE